jgi:two-component system, cell cycle response regulator DivK
MTTTILIVEDDPTNIQLLSRLLTMKGYNSLVAENRQDAVALAREKRPDLILMDIQMPDERGGSVSPTAGIEATKELKSDPDTAGIPIVATSAHDLPEQRKRFLEAGSDDIQSKPYTDFNELLETIARNLNRSGNT